MATRKKLRQKATKNFRKEMKSIGLKISIPDASRVVRAYNAPGDWQKIHEIIGSYGAIFTQEDPCSCGGEHNCNREDHRVEMGDKESKEFLDMDIFYAYRFEGGSH